MSKTGTTTKADVLAYLKAEEDPRGIENWKKHAKRSGGLKSHGIGLTRLRKYAKEIGRDAKLAQQLWKTKIYEAKVISLLVDDPKTMTVEQVETQVDELKGGHLEHVFSSCGASLAKAPFAVELTEKWIRSKDRVRRSCGYGLLYEISKWKKKSAPDDAFFRAYIDRIEKTWPKQSTSILLAMGGALMGMGGRSKNLYGPALKLARKIGPIEFDPTGKCDPFDVAKNLSNPIIKERLGL